MKKLLILAFVAIITVAFVGGAMAVPAGKTVEYPDGDAGKVTFDGKMHADKGAKCNDCHPALFQMKKAATKMTMKDMEAGKGCGSCHNGTKAFSVKDQAACAKCHKK